MNAMDLIGAVGAGLLKNRLASRTEQDGVARYLLDHLTGDQVAAIVRALLADEETAAKFTIRIPTEIAAEHDLPSSVVTDERSVALRNTIWDTPALLLANSEDDQGASLQDVTRLGAKFITAEPELWVECAARDLHLPEPQIEVWQAALKGLTRAEDWSLQQLASYVADARRCINEESRPLVDALGWALPALFLPRDSGYFRSMRAKDQESPAKWKRMFEKLVTERAPLLIKQRKPGQIIENEELRSQWENVKNDVLQSAHPAIEAFIAAPPGVNVEAGELAKREFEEDGIFQLFSGLRQKKLTLAEETLEHFDLNLPGRLTASEQEYLEQLRKARSREGREEDKEFFEAHREDLGQDRSLRAKWEKFVFGKAVECQDFLAGLLLAIERLYGLTSSASGPRKLEIRSTRQSKSQLLDLNADVGTAFCVKYRGLPQLMGHDVTWDVPYLFAYDELLEQAAKRKKYRRNESTSRTSLQIKFDVTLKVVQGASTEKNTVQIHWMGQPSAMGIELAGDLGRLAQRPLTISSVARQSVSRKGALQSISLADVTTIEPAFGKDSGTLVPRLTGGADLEKTFPKRLKDALAANPPRINKAAYETIEGAWKKFVVEYRAALEAWRTIGLTSDKLLTQATVYGELLEKIRAQAAGDVNRQELLQPILNIGCTSVTGGAPAAIIAPWHPMRLMALAVKARLVAGLVRFVLSAEEVNFGDSRLFFSDLRRELEHAWYPEVAAGYVSGEPVLLAETSTLNDYSLMERPVRDPSEVVTDVDPREAAGQIKQLILRYLELQPHEASNLSIMLYNCDAAGLPMEAVNALSSVSDNGAVHCNVLVRHKDRNRLGRVYGELLERGDSDPDALVVSEVSQNFMSKLRIGVMLDEGQTGGPQKHVDVAFLHDVVARQAREAWFPVNKTGVSVDVAEHVPARWSYRRVTGEDELKSTSFVVCPRQPQEGWSYLDAVAAVVRRESHPLGQHMLPARQISFEDHNIRSMFAEVHNNAEWVATYDELLDKRQLRAQNVKVIRYRRQRTNGRNVVVSSTSELRLLHVLVRKRLGELSLGLSDDRLAALAERMINDALEISGDIVLRAAKRGVSAGELIGLVMSRELIREELGTSNISAWFLLDDYAEWLGQREEGIADILGLCVENVDGAHRLRMIVTEAKYVGAENCGEARRVSQRQLRETVRRMESALFGDPGRLDRDLWLSRISDLLLDGTAPIGQAQTLETVRDGIRQGKVAIDLRGYSHVFVAHPADGGGVASEQEVLPEIENGLQEVFSRSDLRALVLAYEGAQSTTTVRSRIGPELVWEHQNFRVPASRVSWAVRAGTEGTPAPSATDSATAPLEVFEPRSASASSRAPVEAPTTTSSPVTAAGEEPVPAPPAEATSFMLLVAERASHRSGTTAADDDWLKATEQKLRTALLSYSLQAKVTGSRLTPNAALVRFMGSDRLRIEDVEAKRSALLTTHGLKIVAVSPLPGEIVISVERPKRQTVSLWDLWARRELNVNAAGLNTSFVLGLKELDGDLLYLNLGSALGPDGAHEPHTLIAGSTGSGKSVLIQALIMDIAATNSSRLAHIHVIDPKMGVDYGPLEHLPHVQGGIIIDQERAIEVLEELVAEMERRYMLFRTRGVRDLKTFNQKAAPEERLPMKFVVHDEFAEWMLTDTYRDAVTGIVSRLGVKARAAGIHLFFAAQRPDANVMPVQLRDNLGNRLILKVASVGTSEIALGIKGAESLLGQGHMAARLSGQVIFAQAPFLSDDDIDAVVEAIRKGEG